MGNITRRQNVAVEETGEQVPQILYKYPPRNGNFFGSHFIMGGERFDSPLPESYLFGENGDLNFLGSKPTAFPYPAPSANEPTKTIKSLVNIRKESVRFARVINEKIIDSYNESVFCKSESMDEGSQATYNIEFIFDSDAKCAITIYYFCTEEITSSGVKLVPRDGLMSATFHYGKGPNQYFSQPAHIFNPQLLAEEDIVHKINKDRYPIAIHCLTGEGAAEGRQSHTTICVIDHHSENGTYVLRALKQKIFADGLSYLLQEIYGIENKAINKPSIEDDMEDHGSECVICMSESRDTLILPCRHLCLCNSCADSLRYQANNCPICRAPFRALLQIRAVQKAVNHTSHAVVQQNITSGCGEQITYDVPVGYVSVSLVEALNGPPQYISDTRENAEMVMNSSTNSVQPHKRTSPHKTGSQWRQKVRKNASTWTSAQEINSNTFNNCDAVGIAHILDIEEQTSGQSQSSVPLAISGKDTLISESELITTKSGSSEHNGNETDEAGGLIHQTGCRIYSEVAEEEDDSENEKLSPLLFAKAKHEKGSEYSISQQYRNFVPHSSTCKDIERSLLEAGVNNKSALIAKNVTSLQSNPNLQICTRSTHYSSGQATVTNRNTDNAEYYTPEDKKSATLAPLCPVSRNNLDQPFLELKSSRINRMPCSELKSSDATKKHLQRKSISAGNIASQQMCAVDTDVATYSELKMHISSLPGRHEK